jgi:hypothetical protein
MNNQFLSFLGIATRYFYKINTRSQTIGFYELRGLFTIVAVVEQNLACYIHQSNDVILLVIVKDGYGEIGGGGVGSEFIK